jgi:mannosyl-3-phosphoglycerate phosphatase
MAPVQYVIFSDLDGTLLDRDNYDYNQALPGLNILKQKNTPLIFCSSKTRAEQEIYRDKFNLNTPFIVEDGAAIYIEKEYFSFAYPYHNQSNGYYVIEFGTPYRLIRKAIAELKLKTGIDIQGYGDLNTGDVARITGLDYDSAARARSREYQETLVNQFNESEVKQITARLADTDLELSFGGRFHSIRGQHDKAGAVRLLSDLYRKERGDIITVGIGDSANDVPLLKSVDIPILVQQPGAKWYDIDITKLKKINGIGPEGWKRAITELFQ